MLAVERVAQMERQMLTAIYGPLGTIAALWRDFAKIAAEMLAKLVADLTPEQRARYTRLVRMGHAKTDALRDATSWPAGTEWLAPSPAPERLTGDPTYHLAALVIASLPGFVLAAPYMPGWVFIFRLLVWVTLLAWIRRDRSRP